MIWLLFLVTANALTQQQYNDISADVVANLVPPTNYPVERADFFGGVVRLPFHDAGSYSQFDDLGKPSGCINPRDPANNGLMEVINGIEPIYTKYESIVSRADYWVIVAHTAIKEAGGPVIPFYWGRGDCEDKYPPTGRLPNAELNYTEVFNVFVARMGLTVTDIVALLGAHTLGRPQPENSGYQFFWTATNNRFTNQFFRDLLQKPWTRVQNYFAFHGYTHQWNDPSPTPFMMLNTDMSLRYANIGSGGDGPCGDTTNSACQENSDTVTLVRNYATNQTLWFNDFTIAWNKLTSLGYRAPNDLKPLQ